MSGPAIDRANSRQDWATPPEMIAACEKRFGAITLDLAAAAHNAKAAHFYDEAADSLSQSWHETGGGIVAQHRQSGTGVARSL